MPLIPLHDANPRLYIRAHYVTIALIVINTLIFVSQLGIGDGQRFDAVAGYAVVPARFFEGFEVPSGITGVTSPLTLVTYQFLHADWAHLAFNMLFLWVFGDNIEDALGHVKFLVFFLLCGIAGGLLQSIVDPESVTPVIGASGAISGVLGGYLLLYPRARLLVLAFFYYTPAPAGIAGDRHLLRARFTLGPDRCARGVGYRRVGPYRRVYRRCSAGGVSTKSARAALAQTAEALVSRRS